MWQLVINTAHKHLSLALLKDNKYIDGVHKIAFKTQSELIMVELDQLFKRNLLSVFDINNIYIGIGPGSYTGVRIGLSVVKVLALLKDFEVYEFNTFEFMLTQSSGTVVMDARSLRAYVGIKENNLWTFQGILTINDLNTRFINPCVGDTYLIDKIDEISSFEVSCEHITQVSRKVSDVHALEPLYIKSL